MKNRILIATLVIIVGFARLAGKSVGIVANQPYALAGVLDVDSSKLNAFGKVDAEGLENIVRLLRF